MIGAFQFGAFQDPPAFQVQRPTGGWERKKVPDISVQKFDENDFINLTKMFLQVKDKNEF